MNRSNASFAMTMFAVLISIGCGVYESKATLTLENEDGKPLKSALDAELDEMEFEEVSDVDLNGPDEKDQSENELQNVSTVVQDGQQEKAQSSGTERVKKWFGDRMKDVADGGSNAAESASEAANDTMEWANSTYKYLKDQGLTTANSASQWLADDYQNMGAWQYKVATFSVDGEDIEKRLNELGRVGWECFDVDPAMGNSGKVYYFKRRARSYLRNVPLRDLLKLAPLMSTEESGEE